MFLFGFSQCLATAVVLQVLLEAGGPKNLVPFACLVLKVYGPRCHADGGHGEVQENKQGKERVEMLGC